MAIPFLRRVLQEPGYGWSRNGELYKPTVSESMREWLWWRKTRFGELTEAREPAQALPVSDELSDPLAPPGGQRSHRRWGRLRLIDDRVQRGLEPPSRPPSLTHRAAQFSKPTRSQRLRRPEYARKRGVDLVKQPDPHADGPPPRQRRGGTRRERGGERRPAPSRRVPFDRGRPGSRMQRGRRGGELAH